MSKLSKKNLYRGDILRILCWCIVVVPILLFLKRFYYDGEISYIMYEIVSILIGIIILVAIFRVTNFQKRQIQKSRRHGWYMTCPIIDIVPDTQDSDIFYIKAESIHPIRAKKVVFCSEPLGDVSASHHIGSLVTIYYDKNRVNWYYMDVANIIR